MKLTDKLINEHLHRDGISVIKRKLMSKKNREDFASNSENSVKLILRNKKCVFVIVQNDNEFYAI